MYSRQIVQKHEINSRKCSSSRRIVFYLSSKCHCYYCFVARGTVSVAVGFIVLSKGVELLT